MVKRFPRGLRVAQTQMDNFVMKLNFNCPIVFSKSIVTSSSCSLGHSDEN